ncbi:hypothetical protein ACQKP1_22930 [Allorhizobium sp. NPDC080224]|uniref:hypothetical protein n=1 Tax=Allorhizobium sp. NPDC080224 TaxID=3390547 RepID=UPI003D009D5C
MKQLTLTLFAGLLTPAVAGNIIWTLFDALFNRQGVGVFALLPVVATLFLLSVYLILDYILILARSAAEISVLGVICEGIHLSFMAAIAILSRNNPPELQILVAAYLGFFIFGNSFGAWPVRDEKLRWRAALVAADAVGLVILCKGTELGLTGGWNIPACLTVSLAVWLIWAKPRTMPEMANQLSSGGKAI